MLRFVFRKNNSSYHLHAAASKRKWNPSAVLNGERQKASGRFHSGAASGDKTARGPARAHHLPLRLRAAIFAPGSYGFSLS